MQNSQAYTTFTKQTKAIGREKMDGYVYQTLENIYDWERDEVEDIIWYRFVYENDFDLAIFMPKLTKYNGIEALKSKIDKLNMPSDASFNIAETLYVATNECKYFKLLIENYNVADKAAKIGYVSRLACMAKKKEVYDKLIDIYINGEDVNQFTAIRGILWADGYLRNIDDMDEIIVNMQLLKMFKKECKEERKNVIADYINGAFECYRI